MKRLGEGEPELVALLDLGSNAVRLLVAGALVVEEVISSLLQKAELTVCTSGVRDGLLWDEVLRGEARALAR